MRDSIRSFTTQFNSRVKRELKQDYELLDGIVMRQGEEYIDSVHQGRMLFNGTGLRGEDQQLIQLENENEEADILKQGHQIWKQSNELQSHLSHGCSPRTLVKRQKYLAEERRAFDHHTKETEKKLEFRDKIVNSDLEARAIHDMAEETSGQAFALFEKLRKNHRVMSFEARAQARREMLEKQAQAKELRGKAKLAYEDSKLLKKHLYERGLEPNSFKPAKPQSNTTEIETIGSETESWDYNLREGYKLGHLDLMDRADLRVARITEAETLSSLAETRESEMISKRLVDEIRANFKTNQDSDDEEQEEQEMHDDRTDIDQCNRFAKGTPQDYKSFETATKVNVAPPPIDYVNVAMATPNLTIQEKAIRIEPIANGFTKETAPMFCTDWGFFKCTRAHCSKRHFYVSREEQETWETKRCAIDSKLELDILQNISQREQIIQDLKQLMKICKAKFESHLSGYVQVSDVSALLLAMNNLRIATVKTVEAVVMWRRSRQSSSQSSKGRKHLNVYMPGGWIVKIGYLGSKLYPGATAYVSETKRFNRDEDVNGKREIIFEYVGVFETRIEAMQVYDEQMRKKAVAQLLSMDLFPPAKSVVRSCGKHFAIESDMGVPNTRCEICQAASFNQDAEYVPSYLWNGQNYLLKMNMDSEFLGDIEILQLFFKKQLECNWFSFHNNPLLLATPILNDVFRKLDILEFQPFSITEDEKDRIASTFGVPTTTVLRISSECIEWFGHVSSTPSVQIGDQLAYISQMVSNHAAVREFSNSYPKLNINILDMRRIRDAQNALHREKRLSEYMMESRIETKKQILKEQRHMKKLARRQERENLRKLGDIVETSEEEDFYSDDEKQDTISFPGRDILTDSEIEQFSGLVPFERRQQQITTIAERLALNQLHTVYYWDRGDYMAVEQVRYQTVGKQDGKWCAGDKGTTFEGMQVRGQHRKHFDFDKGLKEKGKELQNRRSKIQKRLAKSLKRKDFCNPATIVTLIEIGREAKGSLLLMDCDKAEAFLDEWHRRLKSSIFLQAILRGWLARNLSLKMKRGIAIKVHRKIQREKHCKNAALSFVNKVFKKSAKNVKRILYKPLTKFVQKMDGETIVLSVFDKRRLDVYDRTRLVLKEKCFACLGDSSRVLNRRDLNWVSVKGVPCASSTIECIAPLGVARFHRIKFHSMGGGPCYCNRYKSLCSELLVQAYNPMTCETYSRQFPISLLEQGTSLLNNTISQESGYTCMTDRFQGVYQFPLFSSQKQIEAKNQNVVERWYTLHRADRKLRQQVVNMERVLNLLFVDKNNADFQFELCKNSTKQAKSEFRHSHAVKLASQIHKHAMVKASDTAMHFSTHQIELFDDPSQSCNQQAWDKKENANDAVYIQRKWQATKAVQLASQYRYESMKRLFNCERFLEIAYSDFKHCNFLLDRCATALNHARKTSSFISLKAKESRMLLDQFLKTAVKESITLRNGGKIGLVGRQLILKKATVDIHLLARLGKSIFTPRFLDFPFKSQLSILTIGEEGCSSCATTPQLPPLWKKSLFTDKVIATDPLCVLNGRQYTTKGNFRVSMEQSMRMLSGEPASLEQTWEMQSHVEDAICQPPFIGILKIESFEASTCKKTSWTINPIELRELLIEKHVDLPGSPSSHLFSYHYVNHRIFQKGNLTHQTIRNCVKDIRTQVAARLLELVHISHFDNKLRLGKLDFLRQRRILFNKLFYTQWWKDTIRGRTSLKGIHIFKGVHLIAGETAVVNVFENFGDLTIEACWCFLGTRRKKKRSPSCRVFLTDANIRESFGASCEQLVFWNQCVACCKYTPQIIQAVLQRLVLQSDQRQELALSNRTKGAPYTGLSSRFKLLGNFPQPRSELSDSLQPTDDLRLIAKDMYELVHREVLFVSGSTVLVSGSLNLNGGILISALDEHQMELRLKLDRHTLRSLVNQMGIPQLLLHQHRKLLCGTLFSLLSLRHAQNSPHSVKTHPLFSKYSQMLNVGVPRGGVYHAILHSKNNHVQEIAHIVLDTDPALPPPAHFTLPAEYHRILVLSDKKVEEHFRLLFRGPITVSSTHCHLELMERNKNIWLRVRRETSTEQSVRVQSSNMSDMYEEDKRSYLVENFHAQNAPKKNATHSVVTLSRTQLRNIEKRRIEMIRLFQNQLMRECTISAAHEIVWPSDAKPFSFAAHREQQTFFPDRQYRKRTVVRKSYEFKFIIHLYERRSNGVFTLCIYIPSAMMSMIAQFDFDDQSCVIRASSEKTMSQLVFSTTGEPSIANRELSKTAPDLLLHSIGTPRAYRASCSCHLLAKMMLYNDELVLNVWDGYVHHYYSFVARDEESKVKIEEQEPQHIIRCIPQIKLCIEDETKKNMLAAIDENTKKPIHALDDEPYVPPTLNLSAWHQPNNVSWKNARQVWMKANRFAGKSHIDARIYQELLSDQHVGLGAINGGAAAESDPDASALVKHSITLNGTSLDILLCNYPSVVQWLTNRIRFKHGSKRDGSLDLVDFNTSMVYHGVLLRSNPDHNHPTLPVVTQSFVTQDSYHHIMHSLQSSVTVSEPPISTQVNAPERLLRQFKERIDLPSHFDPRCVGVLNKMISRRSRYTLTTIGSIMLEDISNFEVQASRYESYNNFESQQKLCIQESKHRCRVQRLYLEKQILKSFREINERIDFQRSTMEWNFMVDEDLCANSIRKYLTADSRKIALIDDAFFKVCKKDSRANSAKQVQAIEYACSGEAITRTAALSILNSIGNVNPVSFGIWHTTAKQQHQKPSMLNRGLKLKLAGESRIRQTKYKLIG